MTKEYLGLWAGERLPDAARDGRERRAPHPVLPSAVIGILQENRRCQAELSRAAAVRLPLGSLLRPSRPDARPGQRASLVPLVSPRTSGAR